MFKHSLKIFKIFGISVHVDWTWVLLAALITWSLAAGMLPTVLPGEPQVWYWGMGLLGAFGLFLSILLHELAHSLVGKTQGMPMHQVTLFLFGGVSHMEDEPPNARAEFLMAVVGPVTSLVLAGIFYMALVSGLIQTQELTLTNITISYLATVNLVIAVFNMLPGYPLDGGRVLRAILWGYKKNLVWATRISSLMGQFFGFALAAFGVVLFIAGNIVGGLWSFFLGVLLSSFAKASFQQLQIKTAFGGHKVRELMNKSPITLASEQTVDDFINTYAYQTQQSLFPVTEDNQLIGCVQFFDIKSLDPTKRKSTRVADLLQPCAESVLIDPSSPAINALKKLASSGTGELIVVSNGAVCGIVSKSSLVDYLTLEGPALTRQKQSA